MTSKNDSWLGLLLAGVSAGAVLGWFYTKYGPKPVAAQTVGTGGGAGAVATTTTTGAGTGAPPPPPPPTNLYTLAASQTSQLAQLQAAGLATVLGLSTVTYATTTGAPGTYTISVLDYTGTTKIFNFITAAFLASFYGIQNPVVGQIYNVTGAVGGPPVALTIVSSP